MQPARDFYKNLILAAEQWLALLIGITCLAVFLWATLEGHKAFSLQHFSHFDSNAIVAIGWSLTLTVGLLGVMLMRFAFHKPSGAEGSAPRNIRPANGGSAESTHQSKLVATNAGRV